MYLYYKGAHITLNSYSVL